jgi:hypothetical protein
MIVNQNVSIPAGDTPSIPVPLNVDAPPAFDPTGATATWILSKAANSTGSDILLTKDTASNGGVTFQQDTDGLWWAWVALAEADTSDLTAGNYFHCLRVNEANGGRYHAMTGKFTVIAVPDP